MRKTTIKELAKYFLDCRIHGTTAIEEIERGKKEWYYQPIPETKISSYWSYPPPRLVVMPERFKIELKEIAVPVKGGWESAFIGYNHKLNRIFYWECGF